MKQYAFLKLAITTILTIVLIVLFFRRQKLKEGFEDGKEINPLDGIMTLIRRTSGRLMDIEMWKERIFMSKMSPMDLARHHLKSQAKSEDAQTT